MKSSIVTTLSLTLFLGLSACKGTQADASKLVPEGANLIAQIDAKALLTSKAFSDNKSLIEGNKDVKDSLDAAKACNIEPDKFKSVVFAADTNAKDNQRAVFVVAADGIGKTETLNCISGKVKEKNGKEPWTLEEKDGKKTLKLAGDDSVGYIVNDNMVAVSSKAWAADVLALVEGKGKAAVDGSLKEQYAKAEKGKAVWVAGTVPASVADMLKSGGVDQAKDFTFSLDVSNGLAISAVAGLGSPEAAKKAQEQLTQQFNQFKGLLGAMVPASTLDSIKFAAKDKTLSIEAKVSDQDLKTIQTNMSGGGGGLAALMAGGGAAAQPGIPTGVAPTEIPAAGGAAEAVKAEGVPAGTDAAAGKADAAAAGADAAAGKADAAAGKADAAAGKADAAAGKADAAAGKVDAAAAGKVDAAAAGKHS